MAKSAACPPCERAVVEEACEVVRDGVEVGGEAVGIVIAGETVIVVVKSTVCAMQEAVVTGIAAAWAVAVVGCRPCCCNEWGGHDGGCHGGGCCEC